MFLIRVIFLLNYDLSNHRQDKERFSLMLKKEIRTRKEPVEATLALAVDANDPRLG